MEEKLLFYFNLINESLLERKETNGWYHLVTNHRNYLILVDKIIMSWRDDEVNFSHFPIGSDRLWNLNKLSLTDQFGDKIDIVKTEKGWLIGEKECISPEQILNEIDNFIEGI